MPQSTAPAPVTTRSGADLGIVSLPQQELLTVHLDDIELLQDALGPGVHYKPIRLDQEHNEWVVLAVMEPGTSLPMHYHTGPVDLWTQQGRWYYAEYPDQPQVAGSYLYEPGGSVHTLLVPESNTENTHLMVRVSGSNINFNEDGSFHSILDTIFLRHLTDQLAKEPINYIEGGEAGMTEGAAKGDPARNGTGA